MKTPKRNLFLLAALTASILNAARPPLAMYRIGHDRTAPPLEVQAATEPAADMTVNSVGLFRNPPKKATLMETETASLTSSEALQYAAESHDQAGRREEARQAFEQALALAADPLQRIQAQLGLGIVCAEWAHLHEYHFWAPPSSRIGLQYLEKIRCFDTARESLEKVLAEPKITPEQKAIAHYYLASVRYARGEYVGAVEELQTLLEQANIPPELRVKGQFLLGYYIRYGAKGDAIAAYKQVCSLPAASAEQRAEARLAVADILKTQRDFTRAHREVDKVFDLPDLPTSLRAVALLVRGKLFLLEDNVDAAQIALRQAREIAAAVSFMPTPVLYAGGPTGRGAMLQAGSDRAEIELLLGVLDARKGDGAGLRRVLEIPDVGEPQAHEARLQLRLRKLDPDAAPSFAVLFIGSSHTQVRNVPQIVEQLANSAPTDRPGVLTGSALFGGHTPQRLWDLGDGPGTPRRMITQEPWDFLVIEGPFTRDYTERLVVLARAKNIRPVLYEAPVGAKSPYLEEFARSRRESLAMAEEFGMILAPVSHAWRLYLGENPSDEDRLSLYHPDGVHTSVKGAYLAACTIYAAITGSSPLGLAHDMASLAWVDSTGELSPQDARALQEAAWKAVQ